jgi:hypothetical protein
MKKFLSVYLAFALATLANAQTLSDMFAANVKGVPVPSITSAADNDVWLIVKYIGPNASGKVAVSSAGDLTFTTGTVGGEAADTSFECPVSGPLGGVIDVSDTACDTVGEVVNSINSSPSWIAVPYASFLSDDINAGGSGALLTIAATSASTASGLGLKAETAVVLNHTAVLLPSAASTIGFYCGTSGCGYNTALRGNPFQGLKTFLAADNATATYSSGSVTWALSQVRPNYANKAAMAETVTTLWGGVAAAATTVNKTFVALTDNTRLVSDDGTKLVVRVTGTAALTAITHYSLGYQFPSR